MPQVSDIIRFRKQQILDSQRFSVRRLSFMIAIAAVSMLLLVALLLVSFFILNATGGLPSVATLDSHFGPVGRERYEPVRFYDREGAVILYEVFHPEAENARWLYVQDQGPTDIQQHTLYAILAAIDPDFLSEPLPSTLVMARDFLQTTLMGSRPQPSSGIASTIVASQLMPLEPSNPAEPLNQARINLMVQELNRRFPKTKILEWFLNSVAFGNDLYGLDAAARVYLGKPATDLSLSESALLAPIILQPTLNPFDALDESTERQLRLLDEMVELGWITRAQARAAKGEQINIRDVGELNRTPIQEVLAH